MTSQVGIDIVLRGQTEGGRVIKRTLDDIGKSADKATGGVSTLDRQMRQTSGAAQILSRSFSLLTASLSAFQALRVADSMTMLRGRIENSTRSVQEMERAMRGLARSSAETGSEMKTAVDVFQRLSFSRDEIRATVDEMLNFTSTVQRLGVISGASTDAMRFGLTQLGQGLSAGILRAEEFNSILENIPAVGQAIAKEFDVSVGQLRRLVLEGEVLSEDVFTAILKQQQRVNDEFEKFPLTVQRAYAELRTELSLTIMGINEASDGTNILARSIQGVSNFVRDARLGFELIGATIEIIGLRTAEFFNDLAIRYQNFRNTLARGINNISGGLISPAMDTSVYDIDYSDRIAQAERRLLSLQNALNSTEPASSELNITTRELSKNYSELAKNLSDTEKKTKKLSDEQRALNSLVKETYTAQEKYNARVKELENLRGFAKTAEEVTAIERGLKAALDELNKPQIEAHKALLDAIKAARTEEEKLIDSIRELENMRGIAKTVEESQGLATAIERANNELDELRIKAERSGPVAKAFESLTSQIDDGFREAFRNSFTQSDFGWKSLLDGWKNTFKTFLADLAYMALARPVVISMAGAVGGAMGLSSGARAQILGEIGGGTSGFGLSNLGSIGSSLLNGGLYSSTLGNWGGQAGFKLGNALGFGFEGAGAFADFGAGALGNLGYGLIGGLGANLLGLGGGIGGTVGGTIGSLAGGGIGASMGTILGFAGGPVGAILGSFLGSALGGLFGGGKPSDKAQWGGLNLSDLTTFGFGGQTGKKFSQENADFRDAVLGEAGNLARLLQSVGGTTTGNLSIHIGSRDGLRIGSHNGANYGNNAEAFVEAVMKQVVRQTSGLSQTFQTIIKNVGVSDTKKLAEAFEFGSFYESVINPVDSVEAAIKAVNAQFDALAKQARELGLSSSLFTEKLQEQRQAQLDLIKAQQAGFQSLEAMKATFDSWLYDQSLSGTSTLSPLEKLLAAQGNFGGVLDAVRGGDVSQTQQLLQAGQQLLQLGQAMYASSVEFGALEKFVRDSITSVARQLDVPGYASGTMSARRGLSWVGERGPELVNFKGGERVYNAEESKMLARQQAQTDARVEEQTQQIGGMRKDIATMNRQISRLVNKMMAS